jgi:hypothetical protein
LVTCCQNQSQANVSRQPRHPCHLI